MAIYDLGTASLAANGEVTGVGTTWKAPLTLIRVGATIVFKTEPVQIYTISEIISDTQINVYNPNSETVPSGTGYAILAHDGITVQGLAQDVAETLRYYQSRETEVADAVDAFNNFDSAGFESKVTQVNTQHGEIVTIGAQVSADAAQVTTDKDAAAASAASALSDKDAAAASAQQAADYAASLDTQNILRKDLSLSDLTDKPLARSNLDVYSKSEINNLKEWISVDDFGAKGDALLEDGSPNPDRTDDTQAFQDAINAAYRMGGVKVTANGKKNYYIAGTVYVLASESGSDIETNNYARRRIQILDFQGATIIGNNSTSQVFMETGYLTSTGSVESVFGKSFEEYLTIGTTIRNATLINFYQGFRLRDHVFGCEVTDIVGVDVQQLVYTQRCFYSSFRNLQCNGTYTVGLHRYHFTDECNIQPLVSVHTGECDVGIKFEGAVEALTLFNCGIESFRTHGVWIAGAYNIKFDSCYIESNKGNVYGVIATSANNITLDNCWIYGTNMKMFGAFDDNTNVRIMPNNRIGGGAVWWDLNEGSPHNLSDIHWQTDIKPGGTKLPAASAKEASTVEQTIVFYHPDFGLSSVLGKAKQTSKYHPQLVNGKMSNGSSAAYTVGSSHSISGGVVKWSTGIDYTDTQLVYIALKVETPSGTWFWLGFIAGGATATALITSNASQPPSASNVGGKLVISSPNFGSDSLGVYGGEIRLV